MPDVGQYAHIIETPLTQIIRVDSEDSDVLYHCFAPPGNYENQDLPVWRIIRKEKLATNPEVNITLAQGSDGVYGSMKCIADNREDLTYA